MTPRHDYSRGACLCARLATGSEAYGDESLRRPAVALDEIQQELKGVHGWSLIQWMRPDRLRTAVGHLGREGVPHA